MKKAKAGKSKQGHEDEENIENIYQKKTQLEHILLRPDTYIGSIDKIEDKMWIFDEKLEKFVFKSITYIPGLYKIFDEILVNASDNIQSNIIKIEKF